LVLVAGCGDEESADAPAGASGADSGVVDAGAEDAGMADARDEDTAATDAGTEDAGTGDAGTEDAGTGDAGTTDSGLQDTGTEDGGTTDVGTEDGGTEDGGTEDGGTEDGGTTDVGTEDTDTTDSGSEPPSGLRVRAFADEIELEDGQGTSSSIIRVQGGIGDELAGATASYSWNDARFQPIEVESNTFEFELTLETGENTLTVRVAERGEVTIEVDLTYFGAIGARLGTSDQQCLGATSTGNAARCEELCEEFGGEYDGSWGNIGGCRNMSMVGADLDLTDPDAPAPTARATTHDQQCLGSTSAANTAACEEICTDIGGTYDSGWGNIGGCRDIPGSALSDLDFTDGTLYPVLPARDTTHDQQCLGSTSATNTAACEEICTDIGGTYDSGWGNIGGCRDIPGSSTVDLDFTDGTIDPEESDS
jgi:hypothetical protein